MTPEGEADVTTDALLGGAVQLKQPARGHRAGTDAVLLAALAGIGDGEEVADLGSASGAVGLMIAARVPSARVVLAERDPALTDLARENVRLNGWADRIRVARIDAFAPSGWAGAGLAAGAADVVVTNPPFFEGGEPVSPDSRRRDAHVMSGGGSLARWVEAADRLLRPRGRLVLVHRADALRACLDALGTAFGAVDLTPIYPRAGKPASRIVIAARKGGRSPARIRPALILHTETGSFTEEAARLHVDPRGPGFDA